jgi:hypothetical protein
MELNHKNIKSKGKKYINEKKKHYFIVYTNMNSEATMKNPKSFNVLANI